MTADDALANARAFLATARNPDGGWGFVAGAPSEPEPTVLCAGAGAGASGAWLASTDLTYAHLLVPVALAGIAEADAVRDASIAQILAVRGATFPRVADAEVPLDSETPGWPWFGDSFSWVEPTAYAVLSLRKAGRAADPRVTDGIAVLLDRQCQDGGWNYGNPRSFGRELESDLAPTAWACLALGERAEVDRGKERLFFALERPSSLGLAAALLAWTARAGCRTAVSEPRVAQIVDRLVARQRSDGSFGGRVDWTALAVVALGAWTEDRAHVFTA